MQVDSATETERELSRQVLEAQRTLASLQEKLVDSTAQDHETSSALNEIFHLLEPDVCPPQPEAAQLKSKKAVIQN